MQGKTKSFFEDTGIILVLTATLAGGYYLYTVFTDESPIAVTIENSVSKEIITSKIEVKDKNLSIQKNEIIIKKVVEKIDDKVISLINEPESKTITIIEKQTPKKQEIQIIKEKNVDLVILRKFIRDLKFEMASSIIKRDDINETISQELKIRVTVLKDGSYEDLLFVSGDEKLFEMNKDNILKVFPLHVDDKIKDEFPRYVRISIK